MKYRHLTLIVPQDTYTFLRDLYEGMTVDLGTKPAMSDLLIDLLVVGAKVALAQAHAQQAALPQSGAEPPQPGVDE